MYHVQFIHTMTYDYRRQISAMDLTCHDPAHLCVQQVRTHSFNDHPTDSPSPLYGPCIVSFSSFCARLCTSVGFGAPRPPTDSFAERGGDCPTRERTRMFTGLGNPLLLDSKGWVGEWGVVRSIWKAFSQGCSESSGRWWIRVLWIKAFKAHRFKKRPQ